MEKTHSFKSWLIFPQKFAAIIISHAVWDVAVFIRFPIM